MTNQPKTVYILRSQDNPARHYVGLTSDLPSRIRHHNRGDTPSTAADAPWNLVVALHFTDPEIARSFERYLKSGSGRAFAKRHFGDGPSPAVTRPRRDGPAGP